MADCGELLLVIPARGGSKRLPRKNVLPLAGKPLICWTIEAALQSGLRGSVLVTSDDEEILAIARQYAGQGVIAHKRPDALASDTATTVDALIDVVAIQESAGCKPDTIVLLQPTSPLRSAGDIRSAIELFELKGGQDTVVSVCEVDHPTAWIGSVDEESCLTGLDLSGKRSQDHEKEYRLNGAVYVSGTEVLMQTRSIFTERLRASVMPRKRSVDIDEELDFRFCESLLQEERTG